MKLLKRKFSIVVILLVIASLAVPGTVFAQENETAETAGDETVLAEEESESEDNETVLTEEESESEDEETESSEDEEEASDEETESSEDGEETSDEETGSSEDDETSDDESTSPEELTVTLEDVQAVLETISTSERTIRLESYSGDTRYETAAVVAQAAYPDGVSSKTAIIVCGETSAWPDTLSSSSLAGLLDCPILYTKSTSLPSATEEALETLEIETAIIVGGTSSISSSVEESISEICPEVIRLSGEDRYETQLAVYIYGSEVGEWSENVIIASGSSYADALSVSSVAFSQKMAIFLCPKDGFLKSGQIAALLESNTQTFTIVGGTSSVSGDMEVFLLGISASIHASNSEDYTEDCVERIAGSDRYETSWEIAVWGVECGYLDWEYTGLANGTNSVDALCSSVLQGKTGAPILLITDENLGLIEDLSDYSPSYCRIFGGTGVISQISRNEIAMTLGYKFTEIEGFKIYIDAGHGQNNNGNGYYDSGAVSGSYTEAVLNAELADLVAAALESDGYEVFLNDDGGPYSERHDEAIAEDCNLIISIHFNAGGGTGSMTIIHSKNACEYSSYVADIMQEYLVMGTGLKDRGVVEQQIAILGGSLPAALLEVCFLDNSSDMETYIANKATIAAYIVAGIESL